MRKKYQQQMPLMDDGIKHPHAEDYKRISGILESIPTINEMILQDLTHGRDLRCAIFCQARQSTGAAEECGGRPL